MDSAKECTRCNVLKSSTEFSKCVKHADGLRYICRDCVREESRTKEGVLSSAYYGQRGRSKRRGMKAPSYTKEELRSWLFFQPSFDKIMQNWRESGFASSMAPSIDRIDDSKGYSFDNIQLLTWAENNLKGVNSRGKPVVGVHAETGSIVKYSSVANAARELGLNGSGVALCCRGKTKTSGGYIWNYLT